MDRLLLQKRISQIKKLPSSPQILPGLIKLSKDQNTSMRHYENVIARDPALVAQVLKVVNSPYYGLRQKVSNLRIALTLLGTQEIYRIVLNTSLYQSLHTLFDKISYDFNCFWRHCQVTANAAQFFAEKFHGLQASEAYTAGLLHDVGKLVMEQFFADKWTEVLLAISLKKQKFIEAEARVFGFTHAEIGGILLEHWGIPEEITVPVRFHHTPLKAPSHQMLVNIIYFADKLAAAMMMHPEKDFSHQFLEKDEIWFQMTTRFSHFNIIENEKLLDGLRPFILRELPLSV